MYKIKQFFRRIYNLIRWFPIIWKDQDWDDFYIFEILKFKLKNQAKHISYHDRHLSAKRDAEIMMLCVRLIEKIQEEYYGCEYQDYCEIESTFTPSETHPGSYKWNLIETSEHYDDYFKKYPRMYNHFKNIHTDKSKIAFYISKENEERAHKLLFKILEQNIRRWWD